MLPCMVLAGYRVIGLCSSPCGTRKIHPVKKICAQSGETPLRLAVTALAATPIFVDVRTCNIALPGYPGRGLGTHWEKPPSIAPKILHAQVMNLTRMLLICADISHLSVMTQHNLKTSCFDAQS